MKQTLLIIVLLLTLVMTNAVSATPLLNITKIDKGSTLTPELDNKAQFEFVIDNQGAKDLFEIYTLVGVMMTPSEMFELPKGTTRLPVTAYIPPQYRFQEGYFNFEYQLKGITSGIYKDSLRIKFVSLRKTLQISADPIKYGDTSALIKIKNTQNTYIDNLPVRFESKFFDSSKEISLKPFEEITITVPINTQDIKDYLAGDYTFTSEMKTRAEPVTVENQIVYLEKEGLTTEQQTSGAIIHKTTITKTNVGNIPSVAQIEITQDIFSRLFSSHSIEPQETVRQGLFVTHRWQKEIEPAQSFVIEQTTNYTIPLSLALLVVFIAVVAKIYSLTAVTVQKQVSFVKTKDNDFALKVNLKVKAKKHVEKIQIIDTLPTIAKLYEKFGKMPDKMDKDTRRMYWNIEELNAGEERVYSYIIYSKMRVVGRFELPAATAVFELNGKIQEVWSNRAFFVSETSDLPKSKDKEFS